MDQVVLVARLNSPHRPTFATRPNVCSFRDHPNNPCRRCVVGVRRSQRKRGIVEDFQNRLRMRVMLIFTSLERARYLPADVVRVQQAKEKKPSECRRVKKSKPTSRKWLDKRNVHFRNGQTVSLQRGGETRVTTIKMLNKARMSVTNCTDFSSACTRSGTKPTGRFQQGRRPMRCRRCTWTW
jgi:hypothetical protein